MSSAKAPTDGAATAQADGRAGKWDMLLALDIGNTAITIGVFDGEKIRARWSIATDVENLVDEYAILLLNLLQTEGLGAADIDEAVLGSVVPSLTPVFQEVCRRYFKVTPLVVDPGVRTGIRILYDSPRDVGADRVIDAVAAIKLYGPPLIIVDFGTATVFDAISREGDYVGGAIAPGIGISLEALFERTAKLPRIELERPKNAIGKTTVTRHAVGHHLRLRGADRRHYRPHEEGARRRGESHRDRRLRAAHRQGDAGHPGSERGPHARRAAAHSGGQPGAGLDRQSAR